MDTSPVLSEYVDRLQQLGTSFRKLRRHHAVAATGLTIAIILFLILSFYALRQRVPPWWPLLAVPPIVVSAVCCQRVKDGLSKTRRLTRFYEHGLQRLNGMWVGNGFAGDEFDDPDHLYAKDLNVLGRGSLFELLCIARTAAGRKRLADYLLETPTLGEAIERQNAVRELQSRIDLREETTLLGKFEFSEVAVESFEDWLSSPVAPTNQYLHLIAALTSSLTAVIVLAGVVGLLSLVQVVIWISPFVLFHSIVGFIFKRRVNQMTDMLRGVWMDTRVLREGLQLLEVQEFRSARLREILDLIHNSSKSVRRLEQLVGGFYERNKEWFYFPSMLLLLGTQLYMAIEEWRARNGTALRSWLTAWAEFEALNSLANYAWENPSCTYPQLVSGKACFEAQKLGNPLIDNTLCVPNDIELNSKSRFYLVSGSNMSGKSTLLRTIGLNSVLALAGAPVRAQVLRLSQLSICASLSVVDSLMNGKSRFLAEVERLRHTIELAGRNGHVLFLVDEILGGTNSRDRRKASEAVIRALVDHRAIGALSTHDMALTEIAEIEGLGGVNVHMGSRNESDPMDFDYLLKPGATKESNALAIARLAGVPV